ncbi:hypothetical protein QBC36DRAFT_365703 [Triangularia setosa]|uniref:Uncharacterized protein n=1 Tax=Triangularia setosa TaxID=2587417 RepID=A0AAN7A3A0_9PEZI|nr:hypothetical protein QBC36DRAFT_365703 [Podospora setosa]
MQLTTLILSTSLVRLLTYCVATGNSVECRRGCPKPSDPCQYAEDDGSCSYGYAACLQKMGCGGRAGELDCAGTATDAKVARSRADDFLGRIWLTGMALMLF